MLHIDVIDWGEYENIKMHGQIHPGLGHNTSFVGPWLPLIIGLPYDHPHPSGSGQFAYKNFGY